MEQSQAPAIWFTALETFRASDDGWERFIAFSQLTHLDRVVSLDSMLCPPVFDSISDDMWPYIVGNERFLFTDLKAMQRFLPAADMQVLGVVKNPSEPIEHLVPEGFSFAGYDLVDRDGDNSALVNCGGFPEAFENSELSSSGLVKSFSRACEIRDALRASYSDNRHADCNIWAIFVEQSNER